MSATIRWAPNEEGKRVDCGSPSATISALEAVFGPFPITLREGDCPVLLAMAATARAGSLGGPSADTLGELAVNVVAAGTIRVWAVY